MILELRVFFAFRCACCSYPNLVFFHFILGFRGQHVDPEELFRNIFGDNFNFKNFSESDEFESTQYGFAQAQEVCKSWKTSQQIY